MAYLLNAYHICYVLVPKQGNKRWIMNNSVNVLGIDEQEAVKNAAPYFEQEKLKKLQRSLTLDKLFPGYEVEIKKINRIPFYLPNLSCEERLIPAFNFLGKGIFED